MIDRKMDLTIHSSAIRKYIMNHTTPELKRLASQRDINDAINESCNGVSLGIVSVSLLNDTVGKYCSKCGECCKICDPILITEEEIAPYSMFFGRDFDKHVVFRNDKWRLKNTKPCEFLSSIGICNIYEQRPLVCRTYPFNNIGKMEFKEGCKFPLNLVKEQALIILTSKLLERTHPELMKVIQKLKLPGEDEKVKSMKPP
jgi:Fe-S-cluster containining protein